MYLLPVFNDPIYMYLLPVFNDPIFARATGSVSDDHHGMIDSASVAAGIVEHASTVVPANTVKSAYKEPAYKERSVNTRNEFSFPNLKQGTSSLYVYKVLWLLETYFS